MITGSEMAIVDENATGLGVSQLQLMEASGAAVARAVRERAAEGASVTIVAGRGNNGGDAFVAARHLAALDPTVLLLGRPETVGTDIARRNWSILETSGVETRTVRDSTEFELGEPDVIVDAVLGTGVRGPLREPARTAAAAINERDATVLSVDVPSGLDAETGALAEGAVDPDHVVTFHESKPGLEELAASVTVADIGLPEAAARVVGPGDLRRLDRAPDSHKGGNGTVLVIGGGPYVGAPALTAQAALRAGADLAWVATPEAAAELQGYSENLIVRSLPGERLSPEHVDSLGALAAEAGVDAVVIGPGLGDAEPTERAVAAFLSKYEGTVVVDADALTALPETSSATLLCTPHRGELAAMGGPTGSEIDPTSIEAFAAELGATILLKGPTDLVSDGERTRLNRTGHAGMTVGGTGDVLAGVAGGLAPGLAPLQAAALAAYVTGRAGELAAETHGDGLVATDLLARIPAAARRGSASE